VPHTQRGQRLWVYSYRNHDGPTAEWTDAYAFSDAVEWFPQDFENINHVIMTSRSSWFTQVVVCARFVLEERAEEVGGSAAVSEIVGVRSLLGNSATIKGVGWFAEGGDGSNGRAASQTVLLFRSEDDRVEALEKWFGIMLTPAERKGIVGLMSHLRGMKMPPPESGM